MGFTVNVVYKIFFLKLVKMEIQAVASLPENCLYSSDK